MTTSFRAPPVQAPSRPSPAPDSIPAWRHTFWLVLFLAAAVRLVDLADVPVIDFQQLSTAGPDFTKSMNPELLMYLPRGGLYPVVGKEGSFFSYPPVYYLLLGIFTNITGFGIFQAKLLSVFFGLGAILLVRASIRRLASERAGVIGAFLFAFHPQFIHSSRYIRPDIAVVFFVLAALYTTIRAAETDKGWRWTLAASAAGAAFFTHYLGAYAIAALGGTAILLLLTRRIKSSGVFFLAAGIILTGVLFLLVTVTGPGRGWEACLSEFKRILSQMGSTAGQGEAFSLGGTWYFLTALLPSPFQFLGGLLRPKVWGAIHLAGIGYLLEIAFLGLMQARTHARQTATGPLAGRIFVTLGLFTVAGMYVANPFRTIFTYYPTYLLFPLLGAALLADPVLNTLSRMAQAGGSAAPGTGRALRISAAVAILTALLAVHESAWTIRHLREHTPAGIFFRERLRALDDLLDASWHVVGFREWFGLPNREFHLDFRLEQHPEAEVVVIDPLRQESEMMARIQASLPPRVLAGTVLGTEIYATPEVAEIIRRRIQLAAAGTGAREQRQGGGK